MTIDADGFTLTGTGVTPIRWARMIGFFGYCVCGLSFLAVSWLNGSSAANDVIVGTGVAGLCLGVFGYGMDGIVTELRRGPQEIRVFWENVLEAQFEEQMRWAVILYRAPEPKPGVPGPIAHLPLNNLTPAVAGALWDAFDDYAPGRTRPDGGVYHWTTGRKIAALIILSPLLAGIIMLIRLIL